MFKLSEIKGEKSIDILADLVEPVASIAADKEAAELFGMRDLPEGMSPRDYVIQRIRKAIPALLRNHKKDIIKIFSLLSDMTEEEYIDQLSIDGLLLDTSSLITDTLFNAFFTSTQSIETPSGSASVNTAE